MMFQKRNQGIYSFSHHGLVENDHNHGFVENDHFGDSTHLPLGGTSQDL